MVLNHNGLGFVGKIGVDRTRIGKLVDRHGSFEGIRRRSACHWHTLLEAVASSVETGTGPRVVVG